MLTKQSLIVIVLLGWLTGLVLSNIQDGPHTTLNQYNKRWEQLNDQQ